MINRTIERKNKEMQAVIEKETRRKEFEADILKKAGICRKFVNDKRYADFKQLFNEILVNRKRMELENLPLSCKDNDQYLRQSLVLNTEIRIVREIFQTPERFFKAEEKINKGEKVS